MVLTISKILMYLLMVIIISNICIALDESISYCRTNLNTSGTKTLVNDINFSNTNCMGLYVNDTILDCAGYTIYNTQNISPGTSSTVIFASSSTTNIGNITIKNCNFVTNATNASSRLSLILFPSTINFTDIYIQNNNFTMYAGSAVASAITLTSSQNMVNRKNIVIENNNFIGMLTSTLPSANTIEGIVALTPIDNSSFFNLTISNNFANFTNSTFYYYTNATTYVNFSNNYIVNQANNPAISSAGTFAQTSLNIRGDIYDNRMDRYNIIQRGFSVPTYDLRILNNTRVPPNDGVKSIRVSTAGNYSFYEQWYLDILATTGANILVNASNGSIEFNGTADSNGRISRRIFNENAINSTNTTNYNNYTITMTYYGLTTTTSINLSTNRQVDMRLLSPPKQAYGLANLSYTNSSIYVSWNIFSDTTTSLLFLDGVLVANLSTPTTTYNFTGLVANSMYRVVVFAQNSSGVNISSSISNDIYVSTGYVVGKAKNVTFKNALSNNVENSFCFMTYGIGLTTCFSQDDYVYQKQLFTPTTNPNACNLTTESSIYYNISSHQQFICNGTHWDAVQNNDLSSYAQYQFLSNNFNGSGNVSGSHANFTNITTKTEVCDWLYATNINATGNITAGGDILALKNITLLDNLYIGGNLSVKRPYANIVTNATIDFVNTANTQVVNLTKVTDNFLIFLDGNNITFKQTGDYLLTVSILVTVTTGSNKHIEIWLQKNGVDVNESNTRLEISNSGIETLIVVPFIFDIESPATDNIRLMWYSDTTAAQLLYVAPATSPTRPAVPSVLATITKISEITQDSS